MKLLAILSMLCLVLFVGCGESSQSGDSAQSDAEATTEHAAEEATHAEAATHAVGDEVVLTGTVGCGHCTYQVTDGCSATLKTAEGQFYVLNVEEDTEAFNDRMSGKELEVKGVVAAGDPPHIEVVKISDL